MPSGLRCFLHSWCVRSRKGSFVLRQRPTFASRIIIFIHVSQTFAPLPLFGHTKHTTHTDRWVALVSKHTTHTDRWVALVSKHTTHTDRWVALVSKHTTHTDRWVALVSKHTTHTLIGGWRWFRNILHTH